MRPMAIVLALLVTAGLTAGALAQTPQAPSGQPSTRPGAAPESGGSPAPGSPSGSSSTGSSSTQVAPAPSGKSGDVKVERPEDSPAASPRASGTDTRILGLSPLAAVLIGSALLIVAILAIVSMSKNGNTHSERVDVDRRL